MATSVWIWAEWCFCPERWPNSDESTWIDFQKAFSHQLRRWTLGSSAPVKMPIAPLSRSNQIVCLLCTTSSPWKCQSSLPPSVYARTASSKRRKVYEENCCFKDVWTEKFVYSSPKQFKSSVPHMLRKSSTNVETLYFLFSNDVDFFLLKVEAFTF